MNKVDLKSLKMKSARERIEFLYDFSDSDQFDQYKEELLKNFTPELRAILKANRELGENKEVPGVNIFAPDTVENRIKLQNIRTFLVNNALEIFKNS